MTNEIRRLEEETRKRSIENFKAMKAEMEKAASLKSQIDEDSPHKRRLKYHIAY